jgi:hypothetical protein
MNNCYDDTRAMTDKMPLWWDENAVPRYCEFHPGPPLKPATQACHFKEGSPLFQPLTVS